MLFILTAFVIALYCVYGGIFLVNKIINKLTERK